MQDQDPDASLRLDRHSDRPAPGGSGYALAGTGGGRFGDPPTAGAGTSGSTTYAAYGVGYDHGTSGVADDEGHLLDYVRILHKRRWTALTALAIVFVLGMIKTFTTTPLYEARVQILIESENPNVVSFKEVLEQNKTTNDYYQTQYRILRSRLIARRVLDAEKLWKHPIFTGASARRSFTISLNPLVWASRTKRFLTGLFVAPKPVTVTRPDETAQQSGTIDRFLAHVEIEPVRNSRLVEVRYRLPEAQLAARVANAIAAQYMEQNLEFKYLATREATEFLSQKMNEQRQMLEQSEVAIQKYKEENDAVSLEDRQNIVVQRLSDLNSALTRARTDRIQKEAAWNQIRAIQTDRASLDTHPLVMTNTFVQQLKGEFAALQQQQAQFADKLGERHPEMVKVKSAIANAETKLQAEIAKVMLSIRNDYEAALAQERSLTVALDQQKREALALNRQSIEYGVLRRNASSNQLVFEGLLQRTKETGIEGELRASNIRIVDKAEVPRSPASPNTTDDLLVALFLGSLLGVGLAFTFDYLDDRIKAPEEIKKNLGLPFLGLVPLLDAKELASVAPLVTNGVPPRFTEAYRAIRTNVLFSSAEGGSKSIVVASTGPGEGKTVVSANLALSLALAGQRVLLIDGDMRRPKVHEVFGLSQEPGLSNLMVGNTKAADTIKRTTVQTLWVLAAGKHPPNPAELLGSRRFKDLMASLAEHFDWVIIDSPPVMAVTDATIMSHLATGVVFVVGAEMTSRNAAKAALDLLDNAKAKYVGGVLNRVDVQRNAYYYSKYYRRKYGEYYQESAHT